MKNRILHISTLKEEKGWELKDCKRKRIAHTGWSFIAPNDEKFNIIHTISIDGVIVEEIEIDGSFKVSELEQIIAWAKKYFKRENDKL